MVARPDGDNVAIVCGKGHAMEHESYRSRRLLQTLTCDGCRRTIESKHPRFSCFLCDYDICEVCARPSSSAAVCAAATPEPPELQDRVFPSALPCQLCPACVDPTFPPAKRGALPSNCAFSCKVWCRQDQPWCSACLRKKGSVAQCVLRRGLSNAPAVDDGVDGRQPSTPATVSVAARAGASSLPGNASTPSPTSKPPKQLDEMPATAHERLVLDKADVLFVICTVSALHAGGDGGRLLNEALARRGVRRIFIDELHTISTHDHAASMATYSDALADISGVLDRLCAQLRVHGHARPQIVGFTSTLPDAAVEHVRARARMACGARVVRCAIDRPELRFVRLPMPIRPKESFVRWGQRVLDHLGTAAPPWALAGRIVIFCPTAKGARRLFHHLRLPRRDGVGRRKFLFLGVQKMTSAERSASVDGFGTSEGAILLTNDAWSHGSGTTKTTMVVHLGLAKGPVELFQRSGRGARESQEVALVVHTLSASSLSQYLQVVRSPVGDPLVGVRFVLEQLATGGCLRVAFLAFLGQPFLVDRCGGCDHCARTRPAVDGLSLGSLSHDNKWHSGGDGVRSLIARWPGEAGFSPPLGAVLRLDLAAAPAPYNEYDAHNALVSALIAEKTIRLELHLVECEGGSRCYAACSLDSECVYAYTEQHRDIEVLLHRPSTLSPASAPSPVVPSAGVAVAVDVAAAVASIQHDLAEAEIALERAQRRMLRSMETCGATQVLGSLRLTPRQQCMLDSLHNEPVPPPPPPRVPRPAGRASTPPPHQRKRPSSPRGVLGDTGGGELAREVSITPGGAHAADRVSARCASVDGAVDAGSGDTGSSGVQDESPNKRRGVMSLQFGSCGDESDPSFGGCSEWGEPGSDEEQMERELMGVESW